MAPEDVALLRAVPVSQVLRGSLLRRTSLWTTPTSMGGRARRCATRSKSTATSRIIYDRDHPYPAVAHLALLGYSNGAAALAVSMAVAVAMTAAQLVFGPLATPPCVTSAFGYTVPRCHLKSPSLHGATYCAALTYFLVFFLWHRVPWRRSRLCFFAPLCSALHGPDKERSQRMRPFFLAQRAPLRRGRLDASRDSRAYSTSRRLIPSADRASTSAGGAGGPRRRTTRGSASTFSPPPSTPPSSWVTSSSGQRGSRTTFSAAPAQPAIYGVAGQGALWWLPCLLIATPAGSISALGFVLLVAEFRTVHAGIDAMAHFDIKEAARRRQGEEHSQLEADIASWFDPAVEESMREETSAPRPRADRRRTAGVPGRSARHAAEEARAARRPRVEADAHVAAAFSLLSVYRALDWAVLALTPGACDEYAAGEWGCWRYTVYALGYVVVVNPLLFQVTRLMYSARDDGGSTGSMWRLPLALGVLWGIWSDVALETSEEHFVASAASCLALLGAAMVLAVEPRRRRGRRQGEGVVTACCVCDGPFAIVIIGSLGSLAHIYARRRVGGRTGTAMAAAAQHVLRAHTGRQADSTGTAKSPADGDCSAAPASMRTVTYSVIVVASTDTFDGSTPASEANGAAHGDASTTKLMST